MLVRRNQYLLDFIAHESGLIYRVTRGQQVPTANVHPIPRIFAARNHIGVSQPTPERRQKLPANSAAVLF